MKNDDEEWIFKHEPGTIVVPAWTMISLKEYGIWKTLIIFKNIKPLYFNGFSHVTGYSIIFLNCIFMPSVPLIRGWKIIIIIIINYIS